MYYHVKEHRKKIEDSWFASYIAMKSLGSVAQYTESAQIGFEVLNEAGFYVPMSGADLGAYTIVMARETAMFGYLLTSLIFPIPTT